MDVEIVIAGRDERTTCAFSARSKFEVTLLASMPIEDCGHRSSPRNDQRILGRKQCSLRPNASKRGCAMWLFDVLRASLVVEPNDLARPFVESINECAHEWPNARCKIDLVSVDDRPTSSGPSRDQASVSNRKMFEWSATKSPFQCACHSIERI